MTPRLLSVEVGLPAVHHHHDPVWRSELDWPDRGFGAFAENFSLDGLTEVDVCLGDVRAVGEALVQASQPRSPGWKIARRWRRPDLTALPVVSAARRHSPAARPGVGVSVS